MTIAQANAAVCAKSVLGLAAQRTRRFNFGVWFWGDAIAFDGLIDASELLHDSAYSDFCRGFFESWQRRPPEWTDYLTPGLALARFSQADSAGLSAAARRLLDLYLVHTPRGETGLHYFRPDLPQFRTTALVDSLYHVPPFIAACARWSGDEALYGQAVAMWLDHAAALSLSGRPLLCHNYDHGSGRHRGYGWGRGNGWALLGLIDLIELLPVDHKKYDLAVEQFRRLAAAILPLQDASGFWRTLLDDRESYLETSTAGFFGTAFAKAVRIGLLSTDNGAADRAWTALVSRIDAEGGAFGTSAVTWAANAQAEDLALYRTAPTEVNVWGQGAAMRFAAERLRAGLG